MKDLLLRPRHRNSQSGIRIPALQTTGALVLSSVEHHAEIVGGDLDDPRASTNDASSGTSDTSAGQPVGTIAQLTDYLVNRYWTQFAGTVAPHWPSNVITYNLGNLNVSEQTLALIALILWLPTSRPRTDK
jgi:hypothetical protein